VLAARECQSAKATKESGQDTSENVEEVKGLRATNGSPEFEHHENANGEGGRYRDRPPRASEGCEGIPEREERKAKSDHHVGRGTKKPQGGWMRAHRRSQDALDEPSESPREKSDAYGESESASHERMSAAQNPS